MELRHLRYFTAVVQWRSYREASRRIHIAQPAISQTVADLEQELGVKLFSRAKRIAQLTPEGRAVLRGSRPHACAGRGGHRHCEASGEGRDWESVDRVSRLSDVCLSSCSYPRLQGTVPRGETD